MFVYRIVRNTDIVLVENANKMNAPTFIYVFVRLYDMYDSIVVSACNVFGMHIDKYKREMWEHHEPRSGSFCGWKFQVSL